MSITCKWFVALLNSSSILSLKVYILPLYVLLNTSCALPNINTGTLFFNPVNFTFNISISSVIKTTYIII